MDNIFFDFNWIGLFDFWDLESEVERFLDVFFKVDGEYMYIFVYDSVFEVVEVYFCEVYVIKVVNLFLLDII